MITPFKLGFRSLPVVLALGLSLVGCGGGSKLPLVAVSGVVTLDGAPLPDAQVVFEPKDGSPSFGTTDASGNFRLKFDAQNHGALPGGHVVKITTFAVGDDDAPNSPTYIRERVPQKYNHKSELRADVKPGVEPFKFELVSEKPGTGAKVIGRR